jgi:hypothetical protein
MDILNEFVRMCLQFITELNKQLKNQLQNEELEVKQVLSKLQTSAVVQQQIETIEDLVEETENEEMEEDSTESQQQTTPSRKKRRSQVLLPSDVASNSSEEEQKAKQAHLQRMKRIEEREKGRTAGRDNCGICLAKYKSSESWICCDGCEQWYHTACVELDEDNDYRDMKWFCESCTSHVCPYCTDKEVTASDVVFCEDCKQKCHIKCVKNKNGSINLDKKRFLCDECSAKCLICSRAEIPDKETVTCKVCHQEFCRKCLNNSDKKKLKSDKCNSCNEYQEIRKTLKHINSMSGCALEACERLISLVRKHPAARHFNKPYCVLSSVTAKEVTIYNKKASSPMDFGTVEQKLKLGYYTTIDDFAKDIALIWHNTKAVFTKSHTMYKCTLLLEKIFQTELNDAREEVVYQDGFMNESNSKVVCHSCHSTLYGSQKVVKCSECSYWYHNRCVGIEADKALQITKFVCEPCEDKTGHKSVIQAKKKQTKKQPSSNASSTVSSNEASKRSYFTSSISANAVSQVNQSDLKQSCEAISKFFFKFLQNYYEHYSELSLHSLFYFDVEDTAKFFARTTCTHQMDLMDAIIKGCLDIDEDVEMMESTTITKNTDLTRDLRIGYSTYKQCGEDKKQFHMLEWFNYFALQLGGNTTDESVQAAFALVVRSFMHLGYVKPVPNSSWMLEKQLL